MKEIKEEITIELVSKAIAEGLKTKKCVVEIESSNYRYPNTNAHLIIINGKPILRSKTIDKAIESREVILEIWSKSRIKGVSKHEFI